MPTLNTRIKLKYDTLANWSTANPVLLPGEVAVVAIPTSSESTVGQVTKPAIVFKVGDGTTKFNTLPYASGLAADVYSWAKAATKPSYTAGEVGAAAVSHTHTTSQITDFTTAVEGIVDAAIAEIPSVKIPEYTLKSDSEGTVSLYKDDTVVGAAVPINGFSSIADLARSAVQEIATGSANGTISVDGSDVAVKGLGSAAYTASTAYATAAQGGKADTAVQPGDLGTAASADTDDFATAAQGGKADTAVQNVQSTGSGVATGFTKSGTNIAVTLSQITDAMVAAGANIAQSKINGLASALASINSAIEGINTDIEGLGNALHFAGAGATLPGSGEDGDVYVITSGDNAGKEYIWANGAWQEFGDTSDYLLASTAQATYVPKTTTVAGHALNTAAIEITAGDVGADPAGTAAGLIAGLTDTLTNAPAANSTVTAFDQVGGKVSATFAPIAIGAGQVTSGTFADARIPALAISKITGLQDALDDKLESADIANLATKEEVNAKQDALSGAQLNAVNSGITAAKVATYDGYAADISALEAKPGLDKVGTVTSVAGANGIKVTGTATTTPVVEIDTAAVFILDCGTATTNI